VSYFCTSSCGHSKYSMLMSLHWRETVLEKPMPAVHHFSLLIIYKMISETWAYLNRWLSRNHRKRLTSLMKNTPKFPIFSKSETRQNYVCLARKPDQYFPEMNSCRRLCFRLKQFINVDKRFENCLPDQIIAMSAMNAINTWQHLTTPIDTKWQQLVKTYHIWQAKHHQ
jgi:hypothetical protein